MPPVDGVVHYRSEVSGRCLVAVLALLALRVRKYHHLVELARDERQLERWEVVAQEVDELDRVLDLVVER